MTQEDKLKIYYEKAWGELDHKTMNGIIWVQDFEGQWSGDDNIMMPEFYWKPLSLWYYKYVRFDVFQEEDLPF